ncbi:SDR family oxidoreductase [SAR86 cluster bacterium]|nr:SDR family NAD(P)-dependent oxidoreductase [Candidatus Neomarinimicrobiota bacterium]URQ69313.1 SDR family oxidoreductase [SAR86 cluster bacterium]|tara:strand:+ start:199 stop:948 length:750 start_codon:yes stop_codon:yes gene_type:complete
MNTKTAIITGTNGSIGNAAAKELKNENYFVIGIDIHKKSINNKNVDIYLSIDLCKIYTDTIYRDKKLYEIKKSLPENSVDLLINNAAFQVVKDLKSIKKDDVEKVFAINTFAPFILIQGLYNELTFSSGKVINIGSIHSRLTKKGFSIYASSKSALRMITKSLALELGSDISILSIEPSAISTPMLLDGLKNKAHLNKLKKYHPTNSIGTPEEIAKLISLLGKYNSKFLNGSILNFDGGIGSLLHDPES